ncbi:unnamed protein product, partial [Nesidiocoris tenuis]
MVLPVPVLWSFSSSPMVLPVPVLCHDRKLRVYRQELYALTTPHHHLHFFLGSLTVGLDLRIDIDFQRHIVFILPNRPPGSDSEYLKFNVFSEAPIRFSIIGRLQYFLLVRGHPSTSIGMRQNEHRMKDFRHYSSTYFHRTDGILTCGVTRAADTKSKANPPHNTTQRHNTEPFKNCCSLNRHEKSDGRESERAKRDGLGLPGSVPPGSVPAARRVSMAGESALDQCSNGIVFSCVELSFKALAWGRPERTADYDYNADDADDDDADDVDSEPRHILSTGQKFEVNLGATVKLPCKIDKP